MCTIVYDVIAKSTGRYFLMGNTKGQALLDAPEEWLLDKETQEVLVAERPAVGASVRGQ